MTNGSTARVDSVQVVRVLLAEDDDDLRELVADGLRAEGYAVDATATAADAVDAVRIVDYDVAILDIGLPDGSGYDICEAVRSDPERSTRVLFLTARDTTSDLVRGLDRGADDYLAKPFDFDVLTARLRALLRRPPTTLAPVLECGDIELDPVRQVVKVSGAPVMVTPKEYAVLRYLLSNVVRVVSQEELLEHVWDANADPFTQTVRVTVGTLRRKLASSGSTTRFETVTGLGYRLVPGGGSEGAR